MNPARLRRIDAFAAGCAVALGFCLWLTAAYGSTMIGLSALLALGTGGWRRPAQTLARNPMAVACMALFLLLVAGTFWAVGPAAEHWNFVGKYDDLIYVSLAGAWFLDGRRRRLALLAYTAGGILTLVLSWLIWTGRVPTGWFSDQGPDDATVFKLHITHSVLMAYLGFLAAVEAQEPGRPPARIAWAALALLAAFNVAVMIKGRTGYAVLAVLGLYLLVSRFRWRGAAVVGLAAVLAGGALLLPGTQRWAQLSPGTALAVEEARHWIPGKGSRTSVGLRLDFYSNALAIIREHPGLGVGTGGFGTAYGERTKGTAVEFTRNPHNEYLLITAQLGLPGLALLLILFFTGWHSAGALPRRELRLARGLILLMGVGCLFNSLLLDHTEGMFFAWGCAVLYSARQTRRPVGRR